MSVSSKSSSQRSASDTAAKDEKTVYHDAIAKDSNVPDVPHSEAMSSNTTTMKSQTQQTASISTTVATPHTKQSANSHQSAPNPSPPPLPPRLVKSATAAVNSPSVDGHSHSDSNSSHSHSHSHSDSVGHSHSHSHSHADSPPPAATGSGSISGVDAAKVWRPRPSPDDDNWALLPIIITILASILVLYLCIPTRSQMGTSFSHHDRLTSFVYQLPPRPFHTLYIPAISTQPASAVLSSLRSKQIQQLFLVAPSSPVSNALSSPLPSAFATHGLGRTSTFLALLECVPSEVFPNVLLYFQAPTFERFLSDIFIFFQSLGMRGLAFNEHDEEDGRWMMKSFLMRQAQWMVIIDEVAVDKALLETYFPKYGGQVVFLLNYSPALSSSPLSLSSAHFLDYPLSKALELPSIPSSFSTALFSHLSSINPLGSDASTNVSSSMSLTISHLSSLLSAHPLALRIAAQFLKRAPVSVEQLSQRLEKKSGFQQRWEELLEAVVEHVDRDRPVQFPSRDFLMAAAAFSTPVVDFPSSLSLRNDNAEAHRSSSVSASLLFSAFNISHSSFDNMYRILSNYGLVIRRTVPLQLSVGVSAEDEPGVVFHISPLTLNVASKWLRERKDKLESFVDVLNAHLTTPPSQRHSNPFLLGLAVIAQYVPYLPIYSSASLLAPLQPESATLGTGGDLQSGSLAQVHMQGRKGEDGIISLSSIILACAVKFTPIPSLEASDSNSTQSNYVKKQEELKDIRLTPSDQLISAFSSIIIDGNQMSALSAVNSLWLPSLLSFGQTIVSMQATTADAEKCSEQFSAEKRYSQEELKGKLNEWEVARGAESQRLKQIEILLMVAAYKADVQRDFQAAKKVLNAALKVSSCPERLPWAEYFISHALGMIHSLQGQHRDSEVHHQFSLAFIDGYQILHASTSNVAAPFRNPLWSFSTFSHSQLGHAYVMASKMDDASAQFSLAHDLRIQQQLILTLFDRWSLIHDLHVLAHGWHIQRQYAKALQIKTTLLQLENMLQRTLSLTQIGVDNGEDAANTFQRAARLLDLGHELAFENKPAEALKSYQEAEDLHSVLLPTTNGNADIRLSAAHAHVALALHANARGRAGRRPMELALESVVASLGEYCPLHVAYLDSLALFFHHIQLHDKSLEIYRRAWDYSRILFGEQSALSEALRGNAMKVFRIIETIQKAEKEKAEKERKEKEKAAAAAISTPNPVKSQSHSVDSQAKENEKETDKVKGTHQANSPASETRSESKEKSKDKESEKDKPKHKDGKKEKVKSKAPKEHKSNSKKTAHKTHTEDL